MAELPVRDGSELLMLHNMMKGNRDAVLWKLEGISDEQARRRIVSSETTLLGLVRHLQYVDRWWVRIVIAGEDIPVPWSKEDPDADWHVSEDDTIDAVVADYRQELALVEAIVDAQDDLSRTIELRSNTYSVRWILMHLIEEIARHAGHADIIRETIDGETGDFRT